MENLQSIFSDPMYSMMASRSGLHPETYWQTLHPKVKEQHLSRVGAPPATYVTEEQYANSQAVGANSGPNAFLSNNPVLAGYDGNPMQPADPEADPRADAAPVLSSVTNGDVVRNAPGALSTPVGTPVATAAPQTNVPPANDLTAAALLKKQEGVLAQDNIGQRQKLETMIRDLEQGLSSAADLPRLEQLKAKLSELGGPTAENVSTPEYDAASEDYTRQLKDAQVMAIEARPTVNAARTEIQNLLPLISDPTLSNEIKAGVQSRIEDAQAIIAQSEADAGAVRGVAPGAPGYTQPDSMDTPEQAQPVLSNPEQNTANFRPAPGGQTTPVLEDPTAAPPSNAAVLSQPNAANTTATAAANSTSKGGGLGGGNRTTGSTTQSTSRSVSPSTGNARGSRMGYGKANNAEMLMRVGGAMYSGSLQGDGIGAATREYGSIQDDRRAADTAAYEAAEATRLKEAAIRAAAARSGGARGNGTGNASYASLAGSASEMNSIIDRLKTDRNVSGPFAGTAQALFDRSGYGDAERANLRLAMEGIALNEQLLYTAQTKGAITDREMAMFKRPIPKMTDDEAVWIAWLEPRAAVLNQLAQNGISNAASGNGGSPSPSTTTPSNSNTSAADAIVGI